MYDCGFPDLVALLQLSYRCIVTGNVLMLFLTVSWIGMQCMIVVFPDLVALLQLSYRCIVTGNVLMLFLTVSWIGMQCMIVVFLTWLLYFSCLIDVL